MEKRAPETRTKLQSLPLRVHSRVRVRSVVIQIDDSPETRKWLLKFLGTTGTVISFDPRYALPFHVKFDNGRAASFTEDNLEVLEP